MAEKKSVTSFERLVATRALARFHPWILAGLAGLYLVTFPIFKAFILVSVPVIVAGWFYYRRGGILATLLAVILNLFLARLTFGRVDWAALIAFQDAFLIGHLLAGIVSVLTGYLRGVFENLYRLGQQLQTEERFLTLLGIMIRKITMLSASSVSNDRNPGLLYFDLINHLTNLFVADYGHIIRLDPISARAQLVASTNPNMVSSSMHELDPQETSIVQEVLRTGQVLVVQDLSNSPASENTSGISQPGSQAQSALCIPLLARDYQFGTVILAYQHTRHFTTEELGYAERISHQVALALWGLQQEQITSQQLKESQVMVKVTQALNETERVGLDQVLQLIVDSARSLIPQAEQAVIHLVDPDGNLLIARAISGFDKSTKNSPELRMQVGHGVAGQVLRDGVAINIGNIHADARFLPVDAGREDYSSLLVAPLQTSGHQIGTISVESRNAYAFSEHEAALLEVLGSQAAIAIENTRLFESTLHSLEEVEALYRINQGLAASLDPDILMQEVVDLLQQSFHYHHVQVYLIGSEWRDSVLRQGSGEIGVRLKDSGHRLQPGEGIVGHVAYTGKPFLTNDVDKVVFFYRNPLLMNTKSELAVPIKNEGEVIGVLDIQQVPPHRLAERDLQIASAVAGQLAVALQKANLYTSLQSALEQEQTMRSQLVQSERLASMGKLLASVSHELNNPLQTIQNALFLIRDQLQNTGNNLSDLDIIASEVDRMVALLERLRSTYRPLQLEEFRPVPLNDIIEDVYRLLATHLRHKNISFEFHPDPHAPPVTGLADHLKQVILNLFINATEAMPGGGNLCVDTAALLANHEVVLSIMDNGMGIEPGLFSRIFDPFVTSKPTGTGLGLTITHEIVEQHRGRIQAENIPTGGAKFTIWLPVWAEVER